MRSAAPAPAPHVRQEHEADGAGRLLGITHRDLFALELWALTRANRDAMAGRILAWVAQRKSSKEHTS